MQNRILFHKSAQVMQPTPHFHDCKRQVECITGNPGASEGANDVRGNSPSCIDVDEVEAFDWRGMLRCRRVEYKGESRPIESSPMCKYSF